jgi:GalNAc-alpha-(1->4)-GalNAc-alpha-(1->3)-diNAcBac-PP-undecaprenol alpha-1,4-N-acetyl-D-galactosaminyltransferase
MRVCFVIYSLRKGGAENVLANIANYMAYHDSSLEIYIFTISKNNIDYVLNEKLKIIELDLGIHSSGFFSSIFNNLRRIILLYKSFKQYEVDTVVSFMTTTNILSIIASKLANLPVVVSERINPEFSYGLIWDKLKRIAYNFADYLVLQTDGAKSVYLNDGYFTKIVVIPNALTNVIGNSDPIEKRKKLILNVGRLVEQKGQKLLIEAFLLSELHTEYKLIIAGNGPMLQELNEYININNLVDKVVLIGQIDDLSELYNTASLFVLSSLHEGYPNALMEAMSYGVPCISLNCPYGPADLIDNSINGLLIELDANVIYNLSNSMIAILRDRSMRHKLSLNSKKINNTHTQSCINSQWFELIKSTNNKLNK